MQTFARHVDRLPAEDRIAILEGVPGESWSAIDSAGLLAWLPVEVNLAATKVVAARLGPERTNRFFRELLLEATDSPLLRGFVQAVLRVAVSDPGLYLPWVGRGYELVFRGAGRWAVVEREPGWALQELRDLPEQCVRDSVWLKSVASSMVGLLDLMHLTGTVALRDVDVRARIATFAGRWTPR